MEAVDRNFTRLIIPGMDEEKLSRLGLYSLKFRKMRGDLIILDSVDAEIMFSLWGNLKLGGTA